MSEETTKNKQGTVKKNSRPSPSNNLIIGVIIAVIAAMGGYYYGTDQSDNGVKQSDRGVVATVNGQEITQAEYDERYTQIVAYIESQGQSATTPEAQEEIKNQAVDSLIVEAILLQSAKKDGVTANDEDVSALLAQNKSQFADDAAFQEALTAEGYTESTLMENITRDNIIQQYLEANVDVSSVTATDEEAQDLYNQSIIGSENVPPFEEVRDQIEAQVLQQKQQPLIADFIQQLRDSSTIETFI